MADAVPTLDDLLPPRRSSGASQIPGQGDVPTIDDLMKSAHDSIGSAPKTAKEAPAGPAPLNDDDFKGNLQIGPMDTGIPLPGSVNKGLAQIGSGLADLPMRGRQFVDYLRGIDDSQLVDQKKADDARLNKGVVGTINSAVGQALPYVVAPEMKSLDALGTAAPVVKSALTATAQGAMQPTGTGDSTLRNMTVAGLAGTAMPGVVATGKNMLAGGADATKQLAQTAIDKYMIPLAAGDVSQNKFVRAFSSIMNDTGFNNSNINDKNGAFMRAISNGFGEDTPEITGATIAQAKKRIGADLDTVWNQNPSPYTTQLDNRLQQIQQSAARYPGNTSDTVNAHIAELQGRMQPNPVTGQAEIPGDIANNYQSQLYRNHGGKASPDALDNHMMDIRQAIIDNHNANVSPDTAALNDQARGQWKALKAIEPAVNKAENGVGGRDAGVVTPADLSSAVNSAYGSSPSPFGQLPQIGQTFLKDSSPQTGGSARSLLQNLGLAGLAGPALYSGIGQGVISGVIPAGLVTSGAAALGGLGLNKAAQSPGLYRLAAGLNGETPAITKAVQGLVLRGVPAAAALDLVEQGVSRDRASQDQSSGSSSDDQGALAQTAPAQ